MTVNVNPDESRRAHERLDLRTSATVVVVDGVEASVIKCWTNDVSQKGARLLSTSPIERGDLYIRILTEDLFENMFAASIKHTTAPSDGFGSHADRYYVYGVEFTAVCEDSRIRTLAGIDAEQTSA